MTIAEQLAYCTSRIECTTFEGNIKTGTGFFYNFLENENTRCPVLITNRHVVENAIKGKFLITERNKNGEPVLNSHLDVELTDFDLMWVYHPDKNVDLAALQLAPAIRHYKSMDIELYYKPFNSSLLPTEQDEEEFQIVEDVLMVGYPNGFWDKVNNQPIFRKGTTATHPNIDYNGKKDFLIDMACYPGSSGSPVLLYNPSGYTDKKGTFIAGKPRLILIGVLYAGFEHSVKGEIEIINPTDIKSGKVNSKIPNNLGIILKSERIKELEIEFEKKYFKKSNA